MEKTLIYLVIFFSFNFAIFSQILEVETITDALNYTGDKEAVNKLIITGTIAGNDYSENSEWSKFYFLDTTFPNIEEVEILTDQDIPDRKSQFYPSFFFNSDYNIGALWLKKISAPNVTVVGIGNFVYCYNLVSINFPSVINIKASAFYGCHNLVSINCPLAQIIGGYAFWATRLTSVDFPFVTKIGERAFEYCKSLVSANFPLVQTIGAGAFQICEKLVNINFPSVITLEKNMSNHGAFSVCSSLVNVDFPLLNIMGKSAFSACSGLISINFPMVKLIDTNAFISCINLTEAKFGRDFEDSTEIKFGWGVFSNVTTENIELTLGGYVLPLPDLSARTWQDNRGDGTGTPYVWKSITIEPVGIEEEVENNNIYNLRNNKYILENIEHAELYDMTGRLIRKYNNEYLIDLNDLSNGFYLLKYSTSDNKIKTKKIIKK
jgi:hypothetical protein